MDGWRLQEFREAAGRLCEGQGTGAAAEKKKKIVKI